MKNLFILLIVKAIIFCSCTHSSMQPAYKSTGYLRGQVLSNMVCGYGYVITTDSTVQKFIDPLPAGCGIDLKTAQYPIRINYNWHVKPAPNPCNFIVIDAIERVN
jgi:hypothetical protein